MKNLLNVILVTLFFGALQASFGQSAEGENAVVNIYRVEESAMSGGRGLSIKVYFNDKEITSMPSNTKLVYKVHSTGSTKIKFVAEFGGGSVGKPYVETIDIQNGKEYHISVEAASMTGVKGEIMDEKGMKKISKNKFSDTTELEEGK